jgi:hypothetical protein
MHLFPLVCCLGRKYFAPFHVPSEFEVLSLEYFIGLTAELVSNGRYLGAFHFLHGLSTKRDVGTEFHCERIPLKLIIVELCKKMKRTRRYLALLLQHL